MGRNTFEGRAPGVVELCKVKGYGLGGCGDGQVSETFFVSPRLRLPSSSSVLPKNVYYVITCFVSGDEVRNRKEFICG